MSVYPSSHNTAHDASCRTRRDIYYLRFIADFWEWICEYEYLQIFYVYCLLGHLFHFRYLWSIIPIFMILTYLNCIFGLDISVKLVMLDVSLPELNYATINRVCKWNTECWRRIRCHGSSSVVPYLSVSICDCREQQCSSGRASR